MKKWKINGFIDLYDLVENKITKKDLYREHKEIYKGQQIIISDNNEPELKIYYIVDYLEFCDKNNQLVYACLEDLREEKLNELLND